MMKHHLRHQSALYALGVLEGEGLHIFEKHLEGCAVCREEVQSFQSVIHHLGWAVQPVPPPASLRERILSNLSRRPASKEKSQRSQPKQDERADGLTFVLGTEETWKEILPGIFLKSLYMDRHTGRLTALAKMAPGSRYQAHRHVAPEEFFVLEGSCLIGGQLLHVGDYHRAEPGSIHHETSSEEGCLMLTIFSPNNEILQTTNFSS